MVSTERAEVDLARTRAEVTRLESQLRIASERMVKLENYLELARVYELGGEETPGRRNGGGTLLQASIDILRERGTKQRTSALVEELERRGHHIGGVNKVTNLSGALSRSSDLVPSRTEGWGLKEWESKTADDGNESTAANGEASNQPELDETEIPF